MKVLLISPPVSNIGQAAPSISVLTAWLRGLGHQTAQWDLGIEAFSYFHSANYLHKIAPSLAQMRRRADSANQPDSDHILSLSGGRLEEAIKRLKSPGIEQDLSAMVRSLQTIREAGALVSAAHGFCRLDYSHYDIPGAFASWESLQEAATSAERNLLWDFFCEQALPRINQFQPELLGISISYFSQLLPSLCLTWLVKKAWPELPVLLGGAFLKAVQDDLRIMPTWVVPTDGICIGDGEATLAAYLEALQRHADFDAVPNFLVPRDGRFVGTGRWQELSLPAAPLPQMELEGLELESYLVPRYAIPLPVTRGCHWHQCVYCNISNQARERYRSRGAKQSIADISALSASGHTDWFDFPTDSVLPRDLAQFAQALLDEHIKIRWAAEVLLDPRLDDSLIELLARSGCCFLRFGLESACERTLRLMEKSVQLDHASRIFRTCHRVGIKTGAMLIVGFPTETQAELMQTVDYLIEHAQAIDFLTLHQFTVSPGSRLAAHPELAGVHLLPRRAILTPSLPYAHTNPVAMRPEDLPNVVETLLDRLSDVFPQSGQLWASGIGGWLTFAASCTNSPDFFKRPLPTAK